MPIISIFSKWHIDYTDTTDKTDTETHIGIIDKRYPSLLYIRLLVTQCKVLNHYGLWKWDIQNLYSILYVICNHVLKRNYRIDYTVGPWTYPSPASPYPNPINGPSVRRLNCQPRWLRGILGTSLESRRHVTKKERMWLLCVLPFP